MNYDNVKYGMTIEGTLERFPNTMKVLQEAIGLDQGASSLVISALCWYYPDSGEFLDSDKDIIDEDE